MLDVCMTNLLTSHTDHRYPWEFAFASRSWEDLISQKKYSAYRDLANKIYFEMLRHNIVCPTVTFFVDRLTMRFLTRFSEVKWVITESDFEFTLLSSDERIDINIEHDVEKLADFASKFLNGEIAISSGEKIYV